MTRYAVCLLLLAIFTLPRFEAQASEPREKWALAGRLYADPKARRIGDLLTVLIVESSSSSREASTKTAKKTSTSGEFSFSHPNIDNAPSSWTNISLPKWGLDAQRGFEGGGEMRNEEKITTTISARVMEVLPNGNLVIEGGRDLKTHDETLKIRFRGVVRPADIDSDNAVQSDLVANAEVGIEGKGALSRVQRPGLLTQIFQVLF